MAIEYTDQFFVIDPGDPPDAGTVLSVFKTEITDSNEDGVINTRANAGDLVNGGSVSKVWVDDTITVNIAGVGDVTITGVTFYIDGQAALFTPTDGTVLQTATFVSASFVTKSTKINVGEFGPACFTPGTWIDVPGGQRLIEALQPGDLVMTRDHGAQPLLQISRQSVAASGVFAPVLFAAGALGNEVALLVSQQHRMLITGWRAQLYYGEDEVLVPALHLLNDQTIRLRPGGQVDYIHLLFQRHEIVTAAGIDSESFYPAEADARADRAAAAEIRALFPDLVADLAGGLNEGLRRMPLVRPQIKRFEAALLGA
ncbi:Hint domain-containing protein [Candidatus Halocynthiibacter alkanivorans]|uniref:Hint domain-containing protein n=1 Tax=Candidatus Halocynthiibacter alkanivorans TaxID=2267619 RepID=UPI001359ACB4|nr:Hint domain-containing protein [Candidatus Halocynthiibacter alkanivorans]